jgi:geranylgeranyl diphosphate synthase type I
VTLSTTSASRTANEVLGWGRTLIEPSLRETVRRLPRTMAHLDGYHLGWWDQRGELCRAAPGKAIRPALALLSCQAAGGAPDEAVPAAVAVELVHNFSLLHDDVIDGDKTRRHRPTAWFVFGVNQAILAGDAMLAAAFRALAGGGLTDTAAAVDALGRCVGDLCEGQSTCA